MSKQGANIRVFARALTEIYGMRFQTFRKFYKASKGFDGFLTKSLRWFFRFDRTA